MSTRMSCAERSYASNRYDQCSVNCNTRAALNLGDLQTELSWYSLNFNRHTKHFGYVNIQNTLCQISKVQEIDLCSVRLVLVLRIMLALYAVYV